MSETEHSFLQRVGVPQVNLLFPTHLYISKYLDKNFILTVITEVSGAGTGCNLAKGKPRIVRSLSLKFHMYLE